MNLDGAPAGTSRRGYRLFLVAMVLATLAVGSLVSEPVWALDPEPTLDWAQVAGGTGDDNATSTAQDPNGNVFVAGKVDAAPTFGEGAAAQTLQTSGPSRDAYLAKYAPDGTLLWAVVGGGTGYDEFRDVVVDGGGNAYVTGSFTRTATFQSVGGSPSATYSAVTSERADVIIAKYSPNGTLIWSATGGGPENDVGYGIGYDIGGNVVVAGQFQGTATFGGTSLVSAGGTDVLVTRLSSTGSYLWARRAGGAGNEYGSSAATDPAGNVYVGGPFSGSGFWGWGVKLTAVGGNDAFLARWTSSGVLSWARDEGGVGTDNVLGIAYDPTGGVVVTGAFSGSVTFGTGGATATRAALAYTDTYVARYTSGGALSWVSTARGSSIDQGGVVVVDATGMVTMTGTFAGTVTLGEAPDEAILASAGSFDVLLARFDSTGALRWAMRAGGTASDVGLGVALGPGGSLSAVGINAGPATFGVGPDAVTIDYRGVNDLFVARYES